MPACCITINIHLGPWLLLLFAARQPTATERKLTEPASVTQRGIETRDTRVNLGWYQRIPDNILVHAVVSANPLFWVLCLGLARSVRRARLRMFHGQASPSLTLVCA